MTGAGSSALPPGFGIRIVDEDTSPRMVVTGELDMMTSPQFQEQLTPLLAGRDTALTVDLSSVTFFDSSALNVLLRAQRTALDNDVSLTVVASSPVERVISLTGVADHLTIAD